MEHVKLPIGYEDFCEIIEKKMYYVDKTLLIKDLLDNGGKVTLFTRPRRFGKTLNQSMLKYFFELPYENFWGEIKDFRHLFDGLKIMDAEERYTSEQGQYPVISLTLKSAKQPSMKSAYTQLRRAIAGEFRRHEYLLKGNLLNENDKDNFKLLMSEKAVDDDYVSSLAFLSEALQRFHEKNVVILIDEYDVPLENAYFNGFYDEMVAFIRSLFESALKTNPYLAFAVITGCLRISKESIFTGLNHFKVMTITSQQFSEYYGFTEEEIDDMLRFYRVEAVKDLAKHWYDGYCFGETEIYNPWSILNFVYDARANINTLPTSAWSNSSSNSIIKELIRTADKKTKAEIEKLLLGEAIEKTLHEEITYDSVHTTEDTLWSFLLETGYLKAVAKHLDEESNTKVMLKIPNIEVALIYRNEVMHWFADVVKETDLSKLYQAMLDADADLLENEIGQMLSKSISYNDNQEAFYHGFLLGLLAPISDYMVQSNRESGSGRYDIAVYHDYSRKAPVILFEFKLAREYGELEQRCDKALEQIQERDYKAEFERLGYTKYVYYGIGFFKKTLKIKAKTIAI